MVMMARKMTLEEIRAQRFASYDVLPTHQERADRAHKLQSAMALTNGQHEPVWLMVELANGELAEIYSNLIDLEDEYVELHGGFGIPLRAIHDVGV
jgi:hypothetical protein